jgi:hypothetical protein
VRYGGARLVAFRRVAAERLPYDFVRWTSSPSSHRDRDGLEVHRTTNRSSAARIAIWLSLLTCGCGGKSPSNTPEPPPPAAIVPIQKQIEQFCGNCHATPTPDSFPREMWYDEVRRGYDFYYESGRSDLAVPIQARVTDYYRERAPERLEWGPPPKDEGSPPVRFVLDSTVTIGPFGTEPSAISFMDCQSSGSQPLCWMSDMRSGQVRFGHPQKGALARLPVRVANPVAVRTCNLDGNSVDDLLVTDLGSFLPADHDKGALVWIPDGTSFVSSNKFSSSNKDESAPDELPSQTLLDKVGRVSDVEVADLDLDGDQDLVVAEFGWHSTGGVHVLWNEGKPDGGTRPQFRHQRLDLRPGAIHVACRDFDGDGRLDIAALLSQEHETIVVWRNGVDPKDAKSCEFQPRTLYTAQNPSAGSSGMVVVDFDRDGDQDVVYTNGDTFDSFLNKPTHGVKWLENRGTWPFVEHQLTGLPGAHRALPADLDGDGDLDLAISAFVPEKLRGLHGHEHLRSLIWLEQRSPGEFVRHTISAEDPVYAAMTVYDVDTDGDLDLVAGAFREATDDRKPAVVVYLNQRP